MSARSSANMSIARPRCGDAGDLPLVGVEVGDYRLCREERAGATRIPGEPFEAVFGGAPHAN